MEIKKEKRNEGNILQSKIKKKGSYLASPAYKMYIEE